MSKSVRQLLQTYFLTQDRFSLQFFYSAAQAGHHGRVIFQNNSFVYVLRKGNVEVVKFGAPVIGCCCFSVDGSTCLIVLDSDGGISYVKLSENIGDVSKRSATVEALTSTDADVMTPVKCLQIDGVAEAVMCHTTLATLVKVHGGYDVCFYHCITGRTGGSSSNSIVKTTLTRREHFRSSELFGCPLSSEICKNTTESVCRTGLRHKKHLFIVLSNTQHKASSSGLLDDRTVVISDFLFNSLFTSDVNLANSPVLLLLLPSGVVYWIPFKTVTSNGRGRMLCALSQNIVDVFIWNSRSHSERNPGGSVTLSDCSLVFVGSEGSVFKLSSLAHNNGSKSETLLPQSLSYLDTIKMREIPFSLTGVMCATVFCNQLVFGVESGLCCIDLDILMAEADSFDNVALDAQTINVQNVVALTSSDKDADHSCLYAVTSTGRLLEIDHLDSLSIKSCRQSPAPNFSSHLTALSQQCDQLTRLSQQSADLNTVLQQLSLLSHLLLSNSSQIEHTASGDGNQLRHSGDGNQLRHPGNENQLGHSEDGNQLGLYWDTSSQISVEIRVNQQQNEFLVEIKTGNSWCFCRGWKCDINVSRRSVMETVSSMGDCCRSVVVDLENMMRNEIRVVSFPLHSHFDLPITVDIALVFNVERLTDSHQKLPPVVVLFKSRRLSALDFLKPTMAMAGKVTFCSNEQRRCSADIVQAVTSSRRPHSLKLSTESCSVSKHASLLNTTTATTIRALPSSMMTSSTSHTFVLLLQRTSARSNTAAGIDLMKKLFAGGCTLDGSGTCMRFMTQDDAAVTVEMKEITGGMIQLSLNSLSLLTLAQLHSALIERFEEVTEWKLLSPLHDCRSNHKKSSLLQNVKSRFDYHTDEVFTDSSSRIAELFNIYKTLRTASS